MKICRYSIVTFFRWILLANVFLVISVDSCDNEELAAQSPSSLGESDESTTTVPTASPPRLDEGITEPKIPSLTEPNKKSRKLQRTNTSRDQWKQALREIKNLAVPRSSSDDTDAKMKEVRLFRRWRSLLNEPTKLELDPKTKTTTATMEQDMNSTSSSDPQRAKLTPRFDGFASWERMLQDWSDDVQEYLERVEAENNGYPMSQFGNAEKLQTSITIDDKLEEPQKKEFKRSIKNHATKKQSISLPVPAAKKEGEAVVPYTDIASKSKNILIVTTAALPWMTGTAVNPLLRAAYMTIGRSEMNGSVTLMLPWLERRHDQEQVYGPNNIFDSPEDQEAFIRKWLRDSANLPIPSKELKIKWYSAWQNKAENSVYSMGDITALIPKDEVDICILEEPEHLNWYRAPGDSWTDKFKHVVGIIHTNYFVYAQEQPAAFIRVSPQTCMT